MTQGKLHPISERILGGTAPEPLCQAAARGAVPVPPAELIRVQVFLAGSETDAIAATACSNLEERESAEVVGAIAAEDCPVEVLEWFACRREKDPEVMAALVGNPTTPVAVLIEAAGRLPGDTLERVLDNQVRLLASPDLVEALAANPALEGAARTRLHDIQTELERRASRRAREAARPPEPLPGSEEAVPAPPEMDEATADPDMPVTGPEAPQVEEVEEEPEADAIARIMNMSVPDKIALASKGNKEERSILVRDPVKVVAMAVIRSPKLSEREVETVAAMRNVSEDVIRFISESREWLKSYAVVAALCKNSKTPVRKAQILMNRLNNRDLKMLGADRNISEVVRTTARRFFVARTAPKSISYKR